jgi:5-hydroxyisourate hydrolase
LAKWRFQPASDSCHRRGHDECGGGPATGATGELGLSGGRLTTHVLDIALGRPAAALVVDLLRIGPDGTAAPVRSVTTNDDGRVDGPILAGDAFTAGTYELRFHAGDYLRRSGAAVTEPPFLDVVPIRFTVADATQHFHVPLLVSAFGYSTYRGS